MHSIDKRLACMPSMKVLACMPLVNALQAQLRGIALTVLRQNAAAFGQWSANHDCFSGRSSKDVAHWLIHCVYRNLRNKRSRRSSVGAHGFVPESPSSSANAGTDNAVPRSSAQAGAKKLETVLYLRLENARLQNQLDANQSRMAAERKSNAETVQDLHDQHYQDRVNAQLRHDTEMATLKRRHLQEVNVLRTELNNMQLAAQSRVIEDVGQGAAKSTIEACKAAEKAAADFIMRWDRKLDACQTCAACLAVRERMGIEFTRLPKARQSQSPANSAC